MATELLQSGRDHYDRLYVTELEQEAEWLRRGAEEKVNSIERLCRQADLRVRRLLELGCGTGAVIEECQRRRIASEYTAVDYSETAAAYLRERCSDIKVLQADITEPGLRIEQKFDLVVLSHVIEHLERPAAFLASMQAAIEFDYVLIEVPLEDLLFSRIKACFRDRKHNKAGHVQFFTGRAFERLVESSGLRIVNRRRYVPISDLDTIKFSAAKDGLPVWRVYQQVLTRRTIPLLAGPLWSHLYYAHSALLCKRA